MLSAVLLTIVSLSGCDGGGPPPGGGPGARGSAPGAVTFTGRPRLDAVLPAELSAGLVGPQVGTYADDVTQAAGRFWAVTPPPGGDCSSGQPTLVPLPGRDRVIAPSCTIEARQLSDLRFQSIVDGGGRIAGNFTVGEVDTSGNRKVEVVVTDTASAYVPDDCLAEALAALTPAEVDAIVGSACDVVIAQGVTLTSILTKSYQKVEASASVQGLAFGVDGQVYASNEAFALDYRLRIYPYVPLRSYVAVVTALDKHEAVETVVGGAGTSAGSIITIPQAVVDKITATPTSPASTWSRVTAASAYIQQAELVGAAYTGSFTLQR